MSGCGICYGANPLCSCRPENQGPFDVYVRTAGERSEFLGTYEGTKQQVLLELEDAGYDVEDAVFNGRHFGEVRLDQVQVLSNAEEPE